MPKTYKGRKSNPRKNNSRKSYRKNTNKTYKIKYSNFTKEAIVLQFIEMLNTVKLFHWKTNSYAKHKATDDLYSELNTNVDSFVEVLLGKTGTRVDLQRVKSIPLYAYNSPDDFKQKIEEYKQYLSDMNASGTLNLTTNSDLFNIRDEILANLNQFTYLWSFTK